MAEFPMAATDAAGPPAAAPSDYPSLIVAGYALGLFILAYFLYFADVQIITLLVAPIEQAYQIGDTSFSLLSAGPPVIAIFLVGLPMATLVDRWNRRNILASAVLAWSVMNVLCAFAPSFWVLFILKIGVAMGGAWFYPTVVSLLADLFRPRHRVIAFTLLQLCGTSGVGLALVLSGGAITVAHRLAETLIPLAGAIAWWQWAFILVSLPAPIGAALLLTIREPQRKETLGSTGGAPHFTSYLRQHWRACLAIALGTSAANILIYAARSWLPEFFIRLFHQQPGEAGTWAGLVLTIGSVVGIGAGGLLAHGLRRRGVASANLGVVILSYTVPLGFILAMPFLDTPMAAALVFGVAYLLFNLHGGPQIDIIQDVVPNEFRGRFITLVLMVSYGGAFLGPVALGFLNDHVFGAGTGIRSSMTVTLALSCAAAALCWIAGARPIGALSRAANRSDTSTTR
jgi:MFS family permease